MKYSKYFIDDAHKKARINYFNAHNSRGFSVENKKVICLPYAKEFDNLPSALRNTDFRIVFSYPSTSSRILIRNKPYVDINAGVYKIPCMNCNEVYWGETGRSCAVRCKEHKRDVKNCNTSNALFNHKIQNDHMIDWDGTQLVFKSNSYFKRRIVESSLISSFPCFNLSEGHFKLNDVCRKAVIRSLPSVAIT